MNEILEFIKSGKLESYILGFASPEEVIEVELMVSLHSEVKKELEIIESDLEHYAFDNAISPNPTIKPFILASIDYSDRLFKGEQSFDVPVLNPDSKISDYEQWLDREDMVLPENFHDIYAKIIGYTPQMVSAIVWLKDVNPQEVHDHEFERFLIVEGSCEITFLGNAHHLKAGDFLEIPLHAPHSLTLHPGVICKVILQRVAA